MTSDKNTVFSINKSSKFRMSATFVSNFVQVVRKSGNPFFAGDPARKDDGNWLFRSAPKEVNHYNIRTILIVRYDYASFMALLLTTKY